MTGTSKIPAEKIEAIKKYLEKGNAQNKTAKKFKVSDGLVNKIAKGMNGAPAHSPPKKAIAARVAYAKEKREELIDKFLDKLNGMLDSSELKPGQMRGLAIALGTALDKRRLEEGSTGQGRAALMVLMEEIKKNAEATRASGPTK